MILKDEMRARIGVLIACGMCVAGLALEGALTPVPDGSVQLKGPLGLRLNQMIENHVKATDVDYITAPFVSKTERNRFWQSEFWGKYMHAAMPFWTMTHDAALRANVDRGLDVILASQEPCGYIGNYPDDLRCGEGWDVWGIKYTLMGLLHYYDADPASPRGKRAFDAARRLCDYLIAELGPKGRRGRELYTTGNWAGLASSSVLEPVVWLYRRTHDKKYLDFAAYIVEGMTERTDGPRLVFLADKPVAERNGYGLAGDEERGYVMKHNRSKAYEMMSCYQGLLEYYEVTGRQDFLAATIQTVESILRDEILITGGSACSEAWFHGAQKQHLPYINLQETCVTTTWMRLLGKLLTLTGEAKYADAFEQTFYNAYLAALNRTADEFAAYTPLNGSRYSGHHHCYMHTNCCNANGPRGFLEFLRQLLLVKDDTLYVNLYASGELRATLPASKTEVAFETYTLYPKQGDTHFLNRTPQKTRFTLALRIPAWCADYQLFVNRKPTKEGVLKEGYLYLTREWMCGEKVTLHLDYTPVVHTCGHHVALTRGPIVLARDTRFEDGPLDEPLRAVPSPAPAMTLVREAREVGQMTVAVQLPLGVHRTNPEGMLPSVVKFTDYASAANLWQPQNACRVWLPVEYRANEK